MANPGVQKGERSADLCMKLFQELSLKFLALLLTLLAHQDPLLPEGGVLTCLQVVRLGFHGNKVFGRF